MLVFCWGCVRSFVMNFDLTRMTTVVTVRCSAVAKIWSWCTWEALNYCLRTFELVFGKIGVLDVGWDLGWFEFLWLDLKCIGWKRWCHRWSTTLENYMNRWTSSIVGLQRLAKTFCAEHPTHSWTHWAWHLSCLPGASLWGHNLRASEGGARSMKRAIKERFPTTPCFRKII